MNSFKTDLLSAVEASYQSYTGRLLPCHIAVKDRFNWLDQEAPYAILVHNTQKPPLFIYANQFALQCFKYNEEELLKLPSYLTAPEEGQIERNQILAQVNENGVAYGYAGWRLTKFKEPFMIHEGVIWKVNRNDVEGNLIGHAALFWKDTEGIFR